VDCLGKVSVLMFTTAGATCRLSVQNRWAGRLELTTLRGVGVRAVVLLSCPRTPWAQKEPPTIAAEKRGQQDKR